MRVFPDFSQLWDALVEITSEGHLPLADGSMPPHAEDEDPFADYEEDLAKTLETFFQCDEEHGTWRVGRTGVWPDCFEVMIAKEFFSRDLVALLRSFLRKTFPDASVHCALEDPDCDTGEVIGNLAVFTDQIWATQEISDFVALQLVSESSESSRS